MPSIGDIKRGHEIGYKMDGKYIWHACIDCGKSRWVPFKKSKPLKVRCHHCASVINGHKNWKGGRYIGDDGYVMIHLRPDDPYYPMASSNHYVKEHRLVMAKQFGRCLFPWEIVHHRHVRYSQGSKEDRSDNLPDNLEVVTDDAHKQITILETVLNKRIKELESNIRELEARVTLIEAENVALRAENTII